MPLNQPTPWVAVTGAGSGLGRELAIEFGRRGYRLELAGRRTDALEATLLKAGSPGDFRGLDVTRDSAIREWARDRIERLGASPLVAGSPGSGLFVPN